MITEDYVSFETAKLLKEKGFDTVKRQNSPHFAYNKDGQFSGPSWDTEYNAPTLQMAMKWLREIHHIFINIDWNARPESKEFGDKPYFSLITNMNTNEFYSGKDLPCECASYEEACETAIKYCLENLI